jgi:sugar phosphate isomerase/epimerase
MKRVNWCTLVVLLFTVVLSSLAADPPAAKRDDAASEKLGMKLSLQCWTFNSLSFFETVDKAAGLGIKYIEIFPGQKLKPGSKEKISHDMSDAVCDEVLKKLADAGGLKLVAYGVDGIPTDAPGARKEFDWAKKMGISVLVTETKPNDVLEKLADEYNIRIALHNHPTSWPPDDVLAATKGRSKLLGSCSDIGHWMRRGLNPIEQLKKLEGHIEHLHFKDVNAMDGSAHDVPWGTGKGDVKAVLAEIQRQGFKGVFSIEYEHGGGQELIDNVGKCVTFFEDTCKELGAKK